MILSWSRISLPCLPRSVISLSWLSFCVLRTFFRLFDAISYDLLVLFPDVLSRFRFDGLAYFCVLCSLFSVAVSRHFSSFRYQGSCWWWYARFMWLVNCLSYSWCALVDLVCDGLSMASLMVSTSSSSCSVSNRFLNSSWNSVFFGIYSF